MTPSPTRLARYRRIERRRSLPLVVKALLALSIVLLSVGILWTATGAVGPIASTLANGFGGFVSTVTSVVSSPSPTDVPTLPDAPVIVAPEEMYGNADNVDVKVNVPPAVVGQDGYMVNLWVTVPDHEPQLVEAVPVPPTSVLVIQDVSLTQGRNDFQASIVAPGGEGELSAVATWILDQSKPSIKITSPAKSSSTGKGSVNVKGKTQGRSTVRLSNSANGASTTVNAGNDGLFAASIAVADGINTIKIDVTDVAGNPNETTITVRKGSGSMQVALTGSAYRFTASKLPKAVSFTVKVTGPDGKPVSGATTLFTVTVPGLEAIVSSEIRTNGSGSATFKTNIPKGALRGSGLASVLVTTSNYGQGTDRQVLTVK